MASSRPSRSTALQRLPPMDRMHPAHIAAIVLLLAFCALYLFTLDNGLRPGELEGGDLITHQYAQVQARFSNAPGYPLYTMGGWLWFRAGRLLLGWDDNPIPILSSYSTLWALLALALLYALLLDVIGSRRAWLIAALCTAFYGLTYFFWYYAVTTEQYTSSVAWTLAVVLLAFRWERRPTDRYLHGLALLTGIALAHQITILAILPPLLWFVLSRHPALLCRPRLLTALVMIALLPLLSYAYVYVRGMQHPEWRGAGEWATTWDWFMNFVSTQQGRSELTWSLSPFLTNEFPKLIWGEVTWPGLAGGLLGIAALGHRRAILLYVTIAIYLVFCWVDRLGNWYQVIMPVYALIVVGMAAGAGWLLRRATHGWPRIAGAVVMAALLLLIAYRGAASYPRADSSNRSEDTGLTAGRVILADEPPANAAIFATQPEALSLNYLIDIWGLRRDIRTVSSGEAASLLSGSGFVATEGALPLVPVEIDPAAHYGAIGRTLVGVRSAPVYALPSGLQDWRLDFGGQMRLAGGRLLRNAETHEDVVLLVWTAMERPSADWAVSVRLTAGAEEVAQRDYPHPVKGAYPTSRWLPGEVVSDAYAFLLPAGTHADGVTVLLYRQTESGFENLDSRHFSLE